MRQEKLNFGVILRVFISFLPFLLGAPTISIIMCAYNISMSFVMFGPLTAFISALSSVCISMLIGGTYGAGGELSGLVLAIQAILASAGCIYGYLFRRRFSLGLCLGTAGMLIPQFMYVQHIASLDGLSVAQAIVPSVEDIKLIISQALSEMQTTIAVTEINKVAVLVNEFVTMLLPSVFILSSLVLAYIVIWAVSVQLRKLPIGLHHSFSTIKIPRIMTLVMIVTIVAMYVAKDIITSISVISVISNMILILIVVSLFAGISLADFYLRKKVRFTVIRVIIHILLLIFIPIASFIYVFAALIDSFANFRKIIPTDSAKKGEPDETEK